MWQELCKTREEYLERAKLDTKGYSPRRSETLTLRDCPPRRHGHQKTGLFQYLERH